MADYIVNTPCGAVRGSAGRVAGSVAFKGIRYATAGRWEYPRQVTAWEGVYDATAYGDCCWQPRSFYNEEENLKKVFYYNEFRKGESYRYSEDCLVLNIFAPETAKAGDDLPVLFYIHGGGFTGGCGHEKHFDGPVWTKKGVIGVTVNYRLGPLGFACLPELKQETGGYVGNYGLYDQLTALQWVKDNIAAFGGSSENITIMGQSAGAMSVQQLCLSPLCEGMFQRAVMSSGGGISKVLSAGAPDKTYDFWRTCMQKAGCETLEQFRAIPAEKLFAAWDETRRELRRGTGCTPCIDGRMIVDTAANILAADRHIHVPYMAGSTSHDMMPPILYGMAHKWCAAQKGQGYSWFFDRMLPGDENGAWHSADLWYWFGTLENCWRPMQQKDYALSELMTDYLCNFAKTGDPNGENLPRWQAAGKKSMCMGEGDAKMGRPNKLALIRTMLTNKAVGE
ncbi:MAG: carboxylesterase family protein [Oscillospiraceae bacterium]|nr:carboxylesterase family protein [Oscillospiraceae bacterium]